jgi:hypothetical protein
MAQLTDETLMAYADGRLDPTRAKEVEAMLLEDGNAARKVEALRYSLDLARVVIERPMREPVPQALLDTVLGAAKPRDNVVAFRRRWLPTSPAGWAVPIAAALAMIIVVPAYLSRDSQQIEPGRIALETLASSNPLATVLERTASGQSVTLQDGRGNALILATYRDATGRPCREFEILGEATSSVGIGVACRQANGGWHVIGAAEVPTELSTNGSFLPAGDPTNDPLQAVLTSIGAGRVLSPSEEAELLRRGWVSPANVD